MGWEKHNRLLLLITNLNLRYISRSSIFPQAHTNVNFTETHFHFVGFEVLTAVGTKMAVFWVVAPCNLVEI
jgi:hypothetical protein